jgi:DegV family protein with EDD domain
MLHIVLDSAGDLPAGWLEQYRLNVIPVNIHFGDKTYLDGVEINQDSFYRKVIETRQVPKTSQPSPHQFVNFYRKIARAGETILSIHVTSKLSGTFDSARLAARELIGEIKVFPFDSAAGSAAMGFMGQEARQMDDQGCTVEEICKRLEFIRENMTIILTLDTLEFARMSGRVKTLQAALASLLNVKPIITLSEGMLNMGDRVRTRGKALERVVEMVRERVGERLVNAAVVHAQDRATASELLKMVRAKLKINQLILTDLSISVAANLGPGTVGIVAYPVHED